mmetsp:Transcript_40423/g.62176  ORF Transcript_40423/g.62176 Transcript_40423/m.62176 type:complete len:105 (-) Transcript_40423:441-755(-)
MLTHAQNVRSLFLEILLQFADRECIQSITLVRCVAVVLLEEIVMKEMENFTANLVSGNCCSQFVLLVENQFQADLLPHLEKCIIQNILFVANAINLFLMENFLK